MREVSCRALEVIFDALERKRIPPAVLARGVGVPLETLRNKKARIDWSAYLKAMANAGTILTDAELFQIGREFIRSPAYRPIAVVMRLLFTPRDAYYWGSRVGEGSAEAMWTCIDSEIRDEGPNRLRITLRTKPGYEPCREFLLVSRGAFTGVPSIFGMPEATVAIELLENGASYVVDYPPGGGTLAGVRKAVMWPFDARSAARELRAAHGDLHRRFVELEAAKADLERAHALLDRQAAQLRSAHRISGVIHGDLDLDRTIAHVLSSLTGEGLFDGAELILRAELDGTIYERRAESGVIGPDGGSLSRELRSADGSIGQLRLAVGHGADPADRRELLEYLVPMISLALSQALAFTAVSDYRKNLELKVDARTKELRDARDELSTALAEVKAASAAKDRLFDNVNHEIRTPLTTILMTTAALRRRLPPSEAVKRGRDLSAVEASARRLLRMVDELLLLAASRESKIRTHVEEGDIAALVSNVVAMWAPAARDKGLTLSHRGPERCVLAFDESAMERVLGNLLSNAIKFTREGEVVVSLEDRGPEVEIEVRDTGIGLDEELSDRLFGRFEQGKTGVSKSGVHRGTGIGLSIVKELVEAQGGRVSAGSAEPRGSRFTVVLPRQEPPRIESLVPVVPLAPRAERDGTALRLSPESFGVVLSESRSSDTEIVPSRSPSAKYVVLVAEDDPEVRASIGELLRDEYRVLLAPEGSSALAMAKQHAPHILVSDVAMPGMDGFELTRRFRSLPENQLAPVVLISAYGQLSNRMVGFDAGAVDFVIKPFEPDELLARVRSQLRIRELAIALHEAQKVASLAVLAGGIAHEVRNPANGIVNAVGPLKKLLQTASPDVIDPSKPAGMLFQVLETCAEQIRGASTDLLNLRPARPEERFGSHPIRSLIDRALDVSQPALGGARVLDDRSFADGCEIECNASGVIMILVNLFQNAGHAAGDGGWVRIASRVPDDRLIVEVSDSGPGVAHELRERVFDPFFTTKKHGEGTGLGLTVSRRIAVEHGGALEVRDGAARSVFHLELPLRQADPSRRQPEARSGH